MVGHAATELLVGAPNEPGVIRKYVVMRTTRWKLYRICRQGLDAKKQQNLPANEVRGIEIRMQ